MSDPKLAEALAHLRASAAQHTEYVDGVHRPSLVVVLDALTERDAAPSFASRVAGIVQHVRHTLGSTTVDRDTALDAVVRLAREQEGGER